MEVKLYLKTYLHSLITPFTDCDTHSVKRGMCLYHEIRTTFSRETFSDLVKCHVKSSECHENQYLPKG